MNTEDTSNDKKNFRIVIAFSVLAVVIAVLSSVSGIQNWARKITGHSDRVIISRVNAYFGVEQIEFLILKVKDANGLIIEIYEIQSAAPVFKQKFELIQDKDAYLTLDKNTTNLALSDVDKDGHVDVVAPSVDRNGNLRLNTYKYNFDLKMFEPYTGG